MAAYASTLDSQVRVECGAWYRNSLVGASERNLRTDFRVLQIRHVARHAAGSRGLGRVEGVLLWKVLLTGVTGKALAVIDGARQWLAIGVPVPLAMRLMAAHTVHRAC